MRFGIMATQIDMMIPRDSSPNQLLADMAGFDQARLVRQIASCGFEIIEIGGDLSIFLPQITAPQTIEQLNQFKNELGLNYTVHLPLWSVEPSTPLTPVRKGSVQAIVESIQDTLPLEPEIYVLHATGALAAEFYHMHISEFLRSFLLRQFQNNARESLITILNDTGIPSRKLAIETIEFPFDLTLELADDLDLSICFDTGHVLVGFSGPIDFFEALDASLPRLGEVHLHDGPWQGLDMNIGYGKDHQALGKGDLDVSRLLDRLSEAEFTGPIVFELSIDDALSSIQYIHKIKSEPKK
jgi:sugar phosphate isomerase/epimerase